MLLHDRCRDAHTERDSAHDGSESACPFVTALKVRDMRQGSIRIVGVDITPGGLQRYDRGSGDCMDVKDTAAVVINCD